VNVQGRAVAIVLDDVEKRELAALTRKHGAPQALAERARIVLAASCATGRKEVAAQRQAEEPQLTRARTTSGPVACWAARNARGSMGRKIAVVGTGAVGGYVGAHMVQAGEDVTFIDPWPEHVEHMRKHGLRAK
jgi:phosphoglycerate dehydrogenase-like enzyme